MTRDEKLARRGKRRLGLDPDAPWPDRLSPEQIATLQYPRAREGHKRAKLLAKINAAIDSGELDATYPCPRCKEPRAHVTYVMQIGSLQFPVYDCSTCGQIMTRECMLAFAAAHPEFPGSAPMLDAARRAGLTIPEG